MRDKRNSHVVYADVVQHLNRPKSLMNMTKLFTSLLFIIYPIFIFGQQLSVNETLDYIGKTHTEYNKYKIHKDGLMEVKYDIDDMGNLIVKFYLNKRNTVTNTVHVDDLKKNIGFRNVSSNTEITFECALQNCILYKGSTEYFLNEYNIYITQEYQARKILTAFKYLFSLLDNINFKRDENDPFATNNNSITVSDNNKSKKIKLSEQNGTYGILVNFDNISKSFILDTGASETTISSTLEEQLISNGLITKNDYLPDGLYKIADGSIISQRRILVKQLSVSQYSVKNIVVSVGNMNSPLLLGKNFLDKFKSWSINNEAKILELSI